MNERERRSSPIGTSAVRGRNGVASLDAARKLGEVLKHHPELTVTEIEFKANDVLVQEGIVSNERYAFLVIEGVLVEQMNRFSPEHGWHVINMCEITPWGVGFKQALSASTAPLPAKVSLVAKTDGRAFQIDADWLTTLSKIDKVGLMILAFIQSHDQLMTMLLEERAHRQFDQSLDAIVADVRMNHPDVRHRPEQIKALLSQKLLDGRATEKKLANAEIAITEMEIKLEAKSNELEALRRRVEDAEARAKEAAQGSATAFQYLEGEQERQARSAANMWRLLEAEFGRIPNFKLSPTFMSAMLGLDEHGGPIAADIGQAVEHLFNQALGLPSVPPPSFTPVSQPEPTTKRSTFDLPRLGDDDDREDTLVGVQSLRQPVLPAKKPLRKSTGFSGLTPAVSPRPIPDAPPIPPRPPVRPRPMTLAFGAQPQRSTTPLGVKAPTVPPPGGMLQRTASGNHRIVAPPPSKSPTSDYPEIETSEESVRETRNWGFAKDLGTADLDPNKR